MGKTLVIVESPTKAKKIQEYLGSGYDVTASGGHVWDLPEKDLGFDLATFKEEFVPITKIGRDGKKTTSQDTIKRLIAKSKECDDVILATDPDREGEAISWHLQTILKLKTYTRVEIKEISKQGLQQALSNGRKIHVPMVEAQRARRLIDRMFGYGISPVLSREITNAKSAGRIQSAVLHMLYNREKHVKNFISEDRFTISSKALASTFWLQSSTALYKWANEVIDEDNEDEQQTEGKFVTNERPEQLVSALKGMLWHLESVDAKETKVMPQPPLITSTMQRLASREFGWASDITMKHAQTLFENGFITYMRTDSVRISPEATQMGYEYIKEIHGDSYVPKTPNNFKVSGAAQNAHEAIRPVYANKLVVTSDESQRLYELIHKRFLESLMAPGLNNVQTILIKNQEKNITFKTTNTAVVFDGWRKGQKLVSDAFITDAPGTEVSLSDINIHEGKTKPMPFYNEDRLIRDMEKYQIGRPSTYATVSKTLKKREYITEDKQKNYHITTLGEKAIEWFFLKGAQYIDITYTANMEKELDDIEHHQKNRIELLTSVRDEIKNYFNAFSEGGGMTTEKQKDLLHRIQHEGFDVPEEAFTEMGKAKEVIDFYMANRPPSLKQKEYAEKLASDRGITLGDDVLKSATKTAEFIDKAMKDAPKRSAPPASPKQIEMAKKICESANQPYDASNEDSIEKMSAYIDKLMKANDRPPSEAQIKFAESIAERKKIKYTDAMKKSVKLTKEFIDKNK